jgi:hypothetical protein
MRIAMAGKSKGAGTRARSSVTGKFVTDAYATAHPKTTEKERRTPPKSGGKGGGKGKKR